VIGKFEMTVMQAVIVDIPGNQNIRLTVTFEFGQRIRIMQTPIFNGIGPGIGFGRSQGIGSNFI
jgi:hypothetical protein